jgi:hypothetical protein
MHKRFKAKIALVQFELLASMKLNFRQNTNDIYCKKETSKACRRLNVFPPIYLS